MLDKIIEFSAHEKFLNSVEKESLPQPIKVNIPDWFKKLEHSLEKMTVKGCIPFLETLTTGYLLKTPQDLRLKHNCLNDEGKRDSIFQYAHGQHKYLVEDNINLNSDRPEAHPTLQVEGSRFVELNKNYPLYKFLNPWQIKTPPGYSCLFVPPLNNTDDRFFIVSGIVHTDTWTGDINFPFCVNGDKYEELDTLIKADTPYVQIIPFKRDNWKMKIKSFNNDSLKTHYFKWRKHLIHMYKNIFWKKTSWK